MGSIWVPFGSINWFHLVPFGTLCCLTTSRLWAPTWPPREVLLLLLLTQLCQALVHLPRNHAVQHGIKVSVSSALRVTALLLTHSPLPPFPLQSDNTFLSADGNVAKMAAFGEVCMHVCSLSRVPRPRSLLIHSPTPTTSSLALTLWQGPAAAGLLLCGWCGPVVCGLCALELSWTSERPPRRPPWVGRRS